MATLYEDARRLMRRRCPDTRLVIKFGHNGTGGMAYKINGKLTIHWWPSRGITTLLHEIGHIRLKHVHTEHVCAAQEIRHELQAWKWAETVARIEGVVFDYAIAEAAFLTYDRHSRIVWRYRP